MSKVVLFLIGMLSGLLLVQAYNVLFYTEPVISRTETTHTIETIDTATAVKGISSVSPAKIIYVPVLHTSPGESGVIPALDSSLYWFEEVAAWDTTTADGFEANIQYFTKRKYFSNSFKYPERIITKEVTTTKSETSVETVTKIPEWQLGAGAKGLLKDSRFDYYPFISLAYNTKVWFMLFELEGKALTQFETGRIKMEPEITSQLKIEL